MLKSTSKASAICYSDDLSLIVAHADEFQTLQKILLWKFQNINYPRKIHTKNKNVIEQVILFK